MNEPGENDQRLRADAPADRRPGRPDPRRRPSDPAGTRPKVHPDELRPKGEFRALPAGGSPGEQTAERPSELLPEPPSEGPERPSEGLPEPPSEGLPEPPFEELPERPPAGGVPSRPATAVPPPHAPRFQFILGAFGALGVAAVALAVGLALAPKSKPGPPWSAWKPAGDVDPAVQIAEHVAPQYLLAPGKPLVSVTGGPQAIGGQPVVVALRRSGSAPAALPENGIFYQLCGDGPNCSIPGKPSTARGLLVQREALELALYTFHYLKGTEQVVVTYPPLPPTKGTSKSKSSSSSSGEEAASALPEGASAGSTPTRGRALLFRPADLEQELSLPLADTLPDAAPTVATIERAPEARLVNALTARLLYNFDVIQQSTSLVFLLQSPSVG